jgi:hypothetical protein
MALLVGMFSLMEEYKEAQARQDPLGVAVVVVLAT